MFFNRQVLLLDSLNIARLCPYIKDKTTEEWIGKALKISIENLNS